MKAVDVENQPQTFVRLSEVTFSYRDRTVLDQASLELYAGEKLALVGANGAGKSSLMKLLVGLLKPTSGVVEVFGKHRITEEDFHDVRTRIGYLFQDSDDQLFCPTVIEDVAFGPLNQGLSIEEAEEVAIQTLKQLDIESYAQRVTHKLSGGEKRIVALATILAMKPDVLLLDEPTNALDEASEARLVELLSELDQAMIIVSHDKKLLERLATRAVILQQGQLTEAIMHTHVHQHKHFHLHPKGSGASNQAPEHTHSHSQTVD